MGSRTWREQNRTTHGTIPGFTGLGYTFYYCSGCWLGLKAGHEINLLSDDFLFPVYLVTLIIPLHLKLCVRNPSLNRVIHPDIQRTLK